MSGWYRDPTGRFEYRFHNDEGWTADVASGGQRFVDPLAPSLPNSVAGPHGGAERGRGNGLAVAGMVCGIVAVVVAWVPFIGVLGLIAAVVGLSLSIPGLARARRTGSRRGMAVAGIVTSACGIVLGVLGIVLTVVLLRAIDRFEDPGPADVAVTSCTSGGAGTTVAEGFVENLDDRRRSYTVEVDLGGTTTEWVDVDGVDAGGRGEFTVRGRSSSSEPRCDVVSLNGPVPFGLDADVFD